jgi:hypothetical protein
MARTQQPTIEWTSGSKDPAAVIAAQHALAEFLAEMALGVTALEAGADATERHAHQAA